MTLPASFPISLQQIATELGKTFPFGIQDPWALQLAGKTGPITPSNQISFRDFLGKTGSFNGNVGFLMGSGVNFGNVISTTSLGTFFGGAISSLDNMGDATFKSVRISFSSAPNWTGNISVTNQTNGASSVLTKQNATTWSTTTGTANTIPGSTLPAGGTTSSTMLIKPSA